MRMRTRALVVGLPLLAMLGCAPQWALVHQATPNPLSRQTQLAIESTTFDHLTVNRRPEAKYFADHRAEAVTFPNDKLGFLAGFTAGVESLRGPLDVAGPDQIAGRYVIRTNVESLDPGGTTGVPTSMRTRVTIVDPSGKLVDELVLGCTAWPDVVHATLALRIQDCAHATGADAARYLRMRTGTQK
jgi:hypothetical protein